MSERGRESTSAVLTTAARVVCVQIPLSRTLLNSTVSEGDRTSPLSVGVAQQFGVAVMSSGPFFLPLVERQSSTTNHGFFFGKDS